LIFDALEIYLLTRIRSMERGIYPIAEVCTVVEKLSLGLHA